MTTSDDIQDNAMPADGDADAHDPPAAQWPVPSFEDVLAALPPEQRELVILAASGC